MGRLTVLMQTTLDQRIATGAGGFWDRFAWGADEAAHLNEVFRGATTWAMSRPLYEAVVPWWEVVAAGGVPDDLDDAGDLSDADHEFARLLVALDVVVFSRGLSDGPRRTVVGGDLAAALRARKDADDGTVLLSCGPATLAPLATVPGLIDGYVLAVHPVVLPDGPRLLDGVTADVGLRLEHLRAFDSGTLLAHYAVTS